MIDKAGDAEPVRSDGESSGLPGIAKGDLQRLLHPVSLEAPTVGTGVVADSGPAAESAALAERFARAALSTAIEPGDLDAGRLLGALGPIGLVRAIVDGSDPRRILQLVRKADGGPGDADGGPGNQSVPVARASRGGGAGSDGVEGEGPASSARAERRLGECLSRWRPRLSLNESAQALERAARVGAVLLTPQDVCWPAGLHSLDGGAPIALWIRGDAERLRRLERSIALVGARASTEYGEHVAMESAAGLSDRGFAIVSGGAYGIDAAAHRATLASGGLTVAFLAGGVDRLYPAGNSDLLRRIAADGVVAAELPPGNAPTRWRFLMRNRLIAAAAGATVVVEAGHRSGSLNTAGHAAQLGRPLGAVPGSILSPASAGCHRLIREYDAICVTSADEMAELAGPLGMGPPPQPEQLPTVRAGAAASPGSGSVCEAGGSETERSVLSALSPRKGASADEIAARAALPFTTVAAVLGRLDLVGRARESAGGWTLIEGRRG